jgi:hypothetical protein
MIKRTSVKHTPRYTVQIVTEHYLMIWKVWKCALKWKNAFLKTFLPNFEVRFLGIKRSDRLHRMIKRLSVKYTPRNTVQIVKQHYLMIWKVSKCVCNNAFLKTFLPNFEVRFLGIQQSDRLQSMIKRTSVKHFPRSSFQIVKEHYLMIWKVSKCALKWKIAFL